MWGSPGSLLAATLMHERTGDERWAELIRRIAGRLRSSCSGRSARPATTGRSTCTAAQDVHRWRARLRRHGPRAADARHLLETDRRRSGSAASSDTIAATPRKTAAPTWRSEERARGHAAELADAVLPRRARLRHLPGGLPGSRARHLAARGRRNHLGRGPAGQGPEAVPRHRRQRVRVPGAARAHAGRAVAQRARAFAMHAIAQFEAETAHAGRLRHSLWTGDSGWRSFCGTASTSGAVSDAGCLLRNASRGRWRAVSRASRRWRCSARAATSRVQRGSAMSAGA